MRIQKREVCGKLLKNLYSLVCYFICFKQNVTWFNNTCFLTRLRQLQLPNCRVMWLRWFCLKSFADYLDPGKIWCRSGQHWSRIQHIYIMERLITCMSLSKLILINREGMMIFLIFSISAILVSDNDSRPVLKCIVIPDNENGIYYLPSDILPGGIAAHHFVFTWIRPIF